MADVEQTVRARLTAPDAPFETAVEDVLGVSMWVFKHRARSLRGLLAASAKHGDAEYLIDGEERVSYAEHRRRATSLARVLHDDYGVKKGDRAAIHAANCAEWATSGEAVGIVASIGGAECRENPTSTADASTSTRGRAT